jgi:hypothetical protein
VTTLSKEKVGKRILEWWACPGNWRDPVTGERGKAADGWAALAEAVERKGGVV